jgi:hypothetical protein
MYILKTGENDSKGAIFLYSIIILFLLYAYTLISYNDIKYAFAKSNKITESQSSMLVMAQNSNQNIKNKIIIKTNSATFAPLTDNKHNQLKILVDYQTFDTSLLNTKINGIMKVYLQNGSPIKTSSFPKGFTIGQSGTIQFTTSFIDKTIQDVQLDLSFTELDKITPLSNTIHIDIKLINGLIAYSNNMDKNTLNSNFLDQENRSIPTPQKFNFNDTKTKIIQTPEENFNNSIDGPYAIKAKYQQFKDLLGDATTDIRQTGDGVGYFQEYKYGYGYIFWFPKTGAHEVHGLIASTWKYHMDAEQGHLGYPKSDEYDAPGGGRQSDFQNGSLYYDPSSNSVIELAQGKSSFVPYLIKNFSSTDRNNNQKEKLISIEEACVNINKAPLVGKIFSFFSGVDEKDCHKMFNKNSIRIHGIGFIGCKTAQVIISNAFEELRFLPIGTLIGKVCSSI